MTQPKLESTRRPRTLGQVMVLIALASSLLVGLAGLSVDLVLVYAVKTYLATAADSAAMGGVRALERGVSYADQESEIQRVTEMLFNANFPDDLLLTGESGQISQQVKVAGFSMDPSAPSTFEQDPRLYESNSNTSDDLFRGANVHNGSMNLLLNIAQTARQDASLGGVNIHAIGLGGYGYDADASPMKRMANDPSDSYGVTVTTYQDEPQGSYTYAPSLNELQEAFNKVRSEVMRLTK